MFEFLLFGSMVWFWILFGVWSLALFISVEMDGPIYAAGITLAFFGLFAIWGVLPGGGSLLALLAAQPHLIVFGCVAFFVLGTVWAVVKWWFFVRDLADKRREQIAKADLLGGAPGKNIKVFGLITKPVVRDHKSRIMTWMCFWPFSMVWTLINDPIRRIFKAIYSRIKGMLQRIADRAFEGLEPEEKVKP